MKNVLYCTVRYYIPVAQDFDFFYTKGKNNDYTQTSRCPKGQYGLMPICVLYED